MFKPFKMVSNAIRTAKEKLQQIIALLLFYLVQGYGYTTKIWQETMCCFRIGNPYRGEKEFQATPTKQDLGICTP